MIKEYTNQMRRIELRTKEAEKRASDAMTQVQDVDTGCRNVMCGHMCTCLNRCRLHMHVSVMLGYMCVVMCTWCRCKHMASCV